MAMSARVTRISASVYPISFFKCLICYLHRKNLQRLLLPELLELLEEDEEEADDDELEEELDEELEEEELLEEEEELLDDELLDADSPPLVEPRLVNTVSVEYTKSPLWVTSTAMCLTSFDVQ